MSRPNQHGSGNPRPAPHSSYPTYPAQFPPAGQQGFSGANPYPAGGPPNPRAPPPPLRVEPKAGPPNEHLVPLPPSPTIHRNADMYGKPRPPLFRHGNATSPQFEKARPNKDLPVSANGTVRPNTGGVSTNSALLPGRETKNTWVLPGETPLGDGLVARNDRRTHWVISPSEEMPMDTYQQKLAKLNPQAKRLNEYGGQAASPAPAPSSAAKGQKPHPKNGKPGPGGAGQSSSRG